jgi:hypothetical protein
MVVGKIKSGVPVLFYKYEALLHISRNFILTCIQLSQNFIHITSAIYDAQNENRFLGEVRQII